MHSLTAIRRESRRRHSVKLHLRRPGACSHDSDVVVWDMADPATQRLQKGFFGGPASSHCSGKGLTLALLQLFLFSGLKAASEETIAVAIQERAQASDRHDIGADADNAQ